MTTQFSLVSGMMFGFEYVEDSDDGSKYIVIDLFFLRILVDIT